MLLLACVGTTGGIANASPEPVTLEADTQPIQEIAHIYFNLATGERVASVVNSGQTAGADTGTSVSVWSTRSLPDCFFDGGYTSSFFFGVDNPGNTSLSTGVTLLDYGDIEKDTVVDCVSINWVVAHPDTDVDLDSIGDGVEELAGEWTVWDAENGRAINASTRLPLVNFLFFNLPGNVADPGFLSGYSADLDLVGFGTATDLSFEIGDSDGDCQSAAFCNNDVDTNGDGIGDGVSVSNADRDFDSLPDSDLDGDGLFDFGWTVRFYQPGIGNDFDSDLDTGAAAPTTSDTIGIVFGFPVGGSVMDDVISIDDSVSNAGTGAVDRFVLFAPDGSYAGGFDFGGFQCPDIDTPYVPAAIFAFEMWGPGIPDDCPADLNDDGVYDFFDVSMFLMDFNAGGDYNGDGNTDFFDVSQFLMDYNAGCP